MYKLSALRALLPLILLLIYSAVSLAGQEHSGRVVGVSDGDTITVLVSGNRELKVRFAQIDAPEKAQAFGQRSKQSLSDLVFGKHVKVVQEDMDRFGRVVGRVYVNGLDANAEQVRRGMAWVYRQYARDQSLFGLEDEARAARRGLWSDPNPVPPWEYRRGGKGQRSYQKDGDKTTQRGKCGSKKYCSQMTSCEEARFYLTECGVSSLDKDGDGVPCEALCK